MSSPVMRCPECKRVTLMSPRVGLQMHHLFDANQERLAEPCPGTPIDLVARIAELEEERGWLRRDLKQTYAALLRIKHRAVIGDDIILLADGATGGTLREGTWERLMGDE